MRYVCALGLLFYTMFVHASAFDFAFKQREENLKKYPYRGFCHEISGTTYSKYCRGVKLPYDKYAGMKGRLVEDFVPVTSKRQTIVQVELDNGEKYYFGYFTKFGFYSKSSPFIKLGELKKNEESVGRVFYKHLSVAKTGVIESEPSVTLSNSTEFRSADLAALKKILKMTKNQKNLDKLTLKLQGKMIEYDKFEEQVRISHFPYNEKNHLLSGYVVIKKNKPSFFYKIIYRGNDWLFVDRYNMSYGNSVYKSNSKPFSRDHAAGKIWEWRIIKVTNDKLSELKKILASEEVIIRFYGKQYHHDSHLGARDKRNLNDIASIYELLL